MFIQLKKFYQDQQKIVSPMNGREISCGNNKLMINYSNFFILPNSSIVVYEIIFSFPIILGSF